MTLTAQSQALKPPVAPPREHREVRHGETVVDKYFWLREKSNPEVIKYLEKENAYTEEMTRNLQPFVDALYKEMLGRIKQTDVSVPVKRGSYLYYSRTEEGKQYPLRCRRALNSGPEEIVLDLNELSAGLKFLSLGAFEVSDDGNLLAYTTDVTGFRQYQMHIKDLRTGRLLPDSAPRVTSLAWASHNKTIFLTTEDPVTKRSSLVFRHVLGSNTLDEIYNEKDELYAAHLHRSRDKKFIFLAITATDSTEFRYLVADQPSQLKTVLPRGKDHKYFVDHRDGMFYIRTNKNAKNYRVVTAPVLDPSLRNWKDFLPHQNDVLIEDLALFKNYAVAYEKSAALNRLRVLDFASGEWTSVPFPEPVYSVHPDENPEYDTQKFRYDYESLVTPSSIFDYDMHTQKAALLKQEEVLGGYDPSEYVSERLWAPAHDGAKIPLSVVYKKGFKRDGTAPLFLYAYGSYGFGTAAGFSSSRISLLDRGMTFVIAHVRGGDEMGERWHDDGMLMHKKNTFYDFIDSAEYLIREKWTSKDKLVIEGRSAGGLLMGAVVNMRPDLFRAIHAGVPFVDVMNTMLDPSLPLTVGEYLEWGNPNELPAYEYMKSYSPYDNLKKRAYPAMLVTTSLNDSQVMYWEPAKYVARLRTLKTDHNPLLLKINMGAGHGGSSGRYDHLKEQAFEYAWLMNQVGIAQ
ncbi:MAG: S9 family peptidase [Acidobacteriaceae bacterium]|nr:S9 family peptidase [Acidobacteriaceae bacterium]MBV9781141.1 S9 family peptidase [Acidobacteriaceae bacterium]